MKRLWLCQRTKYKQGGYISWGCLSFLLLLLNQHSKLKLELIASERKIRTGFNPDLKELKLHTR